MTFAELKKRAMSDDRFVKEWESQSPFWQIQEQLIKARIDSHLTQKEIAQKMNVAQSAVARFENTQKGSNISTIIAYARAVGLKQLVIDLEK